MEGTCTEQTVVDMIGQCTNYEYRYSYKDPSTYICCRGPQGCRCQSAPTQVKQTNRNAARKKGRKQFSFLSTYWRPFLVFLVSTISPQTGSNHHSSEMASLTNGEEILNPDLRSTAKHSKSEEGTTNWCRPFQRTVGLHNLCTPRFGGNSCYSIMYLAGRTAT